MDKSVFYILCFLILQNISSVLCADTKCDTSEKCETEVNELLTKSTDLATEINNEIDYIKNKFQPEKTEIMKGRDFTTELTSLKTEIGKINDHIKDDQVANECTPTADGDADAGKVEAEEKKVQCGNKAIEPSPDTLRGLLGKATDLSEKINTELDKCKKLPGSSIKNKYNYRNRENNVNIYDTESDKISCLQTILNTQSTENIEKDFNTEKNIVRNVNEKLGICLTEIKLPDIISKLEKCVTDKYSEKIDSIKATITTRKTEWPGKKTQYETTKKGQVSSTVAKPEYDTVQACADLKNKIEGKGVLFTDENKNPCVDDATNLAEKICEQNANCKSTADDKIKYNAGVLNDFISDLEDLGQEMGEVGSCKINDFDKDLKCFQAKLAYEKDLNTLDDKFEKKLEKSKNEDLKVEACLISKDNFITESDSILATLNLCTSKQNLDALQKEIAELLTYLNKEITGHKKVIEYIVSRINIEPTHHNILAEIEERGKNFTTDAEKKYCEGNATERIDDSYNGQIVAQKKCKTTAESAKVLTNLNNWETTVKKLGTELTAEAKKPCKGEEEEEEEEEEKKDKCGEIVDKYNKQLIALKATIDNEDKIESDKVANLKTLSDCLTSKSTFKDQSREIMVEFLDCINAASNVYLNNMLYICCFILMLMRLM